MKFRYINDFFGYCNSEPQAEKYDPPITTKDGAIIAMYKEKTCSLTPKTCEHYLTLSQSLSEVR